MDIKEFRATKKRVSLPQGEIAYADVGVGPAALFIHGVFMNSLLWRNVITAVSGIRRCIAIDLPAHGDTQVSPSEPLTLASHTALIESFLDSLDIDRLDLVGNDTGGAIAQMFAVRNADRLRTLTLTNCDVSENFPPQDFKYAIDLARDAQLAPLIARVASDLELARSEAGLAVGYQDPQYITQEMVDAFLGRYKDAEAGREIERRIAAISDGGLTDIETELRALDVPTLVVWGTADKFFALPWAYWLRDNVAGVKEVVEIQDGKLFFVDERADEFVPHLTRHWAAHIPSEV